MKISQKIYFILIIFLALSSRTMAFFVDDNVLPDELEARAIGLFKVTKCMVCSGESLYESQSVFAGDMRAFIRQKILEGASNEDIANILKNRYGNKILYYTPSDMNGLLLLLIPILLAAAAVFCVLFKLISTKKGQGR